MSANPKTVSISEFKAKCLAMIDEMNKTRQPLRITRRGKAVAEVVPAPTAQESRARLFGSLAETFEIVGDIMEPVTDPSDWEVLRD